MIIHQVLGKETRKICKVHTLGISHKINRKTNYRKLYENHLAGDKWKYVMTLDEPWTYLQNCNGERKIFISIEEKT